MDANPFTRPDPAHALRRNACPTLAAPMSVADGLLARLRPESGGWTPAQWAALAEAAGAHGNGLIEVSLRGSVQVRGLRPESEAPFRAALDAASVAVATAPAVEVSPLAGWDPTERADPRPLTRALADRIAAHPGPFAPKLAIVCDTGGVFDLGHLTADIRITAIDATRWQIALAGSAASATPIAALRARDVSDAVGTLFDALVAQGPRARARDLDAEAMARSLGAPTDASAPRTPSAAPSLGLHTLTDGAALILALPFGQTHAEAIAPLARAAHDAGVLAIRPGPERTLALIGTDRTLQGLIEKAVHLGFWTRPDDAGLALSLCSGAEAAGGRVLHAAHLAASLVARAPDLADGTLHLHVSTCAKGCGHAGAPGLRLGASDAGFVLTSHTDPHQTPLALLGREAIEEPIDRLAAHLRALRSEGGSTRAALAALVAARSDPIERTR